MPSTTLGPHHALDVDAVLDELDVVGDLAGELDLAAAERAALAGRAAPAEEEAGHLPERVEAEAAGHHRIALEVALEEPEVGLTSSSARTWPLPWRRRSSSIWVMRSNISMGGKRQLRIAGAEQLAAPAGQKLVIAVCVLAFRHYRFPVAQGVWP